MTTNKLWRRAAMLLAVGLQATMLSGCLGSPSPAPLERHIPAKELLFQDPPARPVAHKGDDARLVARKAYTWGDQMAALYKQAMDAYDDLAKSIAAPPKE